MLSASIENDHFSTSFYLAKLVCFTDVNFKTEEAQKFHTFCCRFDTFILFVKLYVQESINQPIYSCILIMYCGNLSDTKHPTRALNSTITTYRTEARKIKGLKISRVVRVSQSIAKHAYNRFRTICAYKKGTIAHTQPTITCCLHCAEYIRPWLNTHSSRLYWSWWTIWFCENSLDWKWCHGRFLPKRLLRSQITTKLVTRHCLSASSQQMVITNSV